MHTITPVQFLLRPAVVYSCIWQPWHILSRIYNCTKPGNRRINHHLARVSTLLSAHATILNCIFRFYSCTNCDQLHTNNVLLTTIHVYVHLKRLWRLKCHCCVPLTTARIVCFVRSFPRLWSGPMTCGLDNMNANCLNEMIVISLIEFYSVC